MGNKIKTDSTKEAQEGSGSYSKPSIYLALQGNDWPQHQALLTNAIEQAQEYGANLYVVNQSGAPGFPPPCVPGMPNYPNCGK